MPDAVASPRATPAASLTELPDLDAHEQRVLGVLLEKERTVPASYPLSLNALRTGCNQSSSREPVVDWAEDEVRLTANGLRKRDLVWVDHNDRVLKYRQLLDVRLGLDEPERALLTVLLLRGAQAPGELKTRTERLHPFTDRAEVETVLAAMAARELPLVVELPKGPGERDHRWVHLLGPVETGGSTASGVSGAGGAAGAAGAGTARQGQVGLVDTAVVLADGPAARDARVRATYDAIAESYHDQLVAELDAKPFDRWLLTRLAELAQQAGGPVADLGCGPGQVTAFLHRAGAEVTGVDLAPEMIRVARAAHDGIPFEVGDFGRLMRPRTAAAWAALTSWYSIVHLAEVELAPTFAAWQRVLAPGGWLALACHAGPAVLHAEELAGQPVDIDIVLHDPAAVRAALVEAGFEVAEWYLRGPIEGAEVATDRFQVLARRPL